MKNFSHPFDGMKVEIGYVKFNITKSLIVEATKLPRSGEKWFKNRGIDGEDWKLFLKNPNMDTTIFWKCIPSTILKIKWRNLLLVLQKFFTCEDQFGCIFSYHIRIMINFLKEHQMSLPYLLLHSLKKMLMNVQKKKIQFIHNTMYHHGLIKILIEFHLQSIGDNWKNSSKNSFSRENSWTTQW